MKVLKRDQQVLKLSKLALAKSDVYDEDGNKLFGSGDTLNISEKVYNQLKSTNKEDRKVTRFDLGKLATVNVDLIDIVAINNRFILDNEEGIPEELVNEFPKVIDTICEERLRQIGKGFDLNHDKSNATIDPRCLIKGAIYYLLNSKERRFMGSISGGKSYWPYINAPKDEGLKANLIKAITMLIAELELILSNEEVDHEE